MTGRPGVVVTVPLPHAAMARLAAEFDLPVPPPATGRMPREEMLSALERTGAGGLVLNGTVPLDGATIARLPATLKIAASTSAGYDHIDLDAARARGLIVTNVPGIQDEAVAEFAFLLMLAAARRLPEYGRILQEGWGRHIDFNAMLGTSLSGRRLGILGMGGIGRALARRARAFGMPILYHNRHPLPEAMAEGATYVPVLEELLPQVDVLSLHAPLTAETEGLIDARRIALLPKGAILINTARGGLVEDEALIAALTSGHLRAAGLDVFRGEPSPDPRYARLPNVVLAPHLASATEETRTAMAMHSLDNVAAVLSGRPPLTPL
ncbi:2-hydroxyacid dehydrogenase [Frigidibacter oleivorans]|uniref:2-hydroxyacid dehydrogenase n=1 Tax=Frigidibacter oleivorans TaxID=2487129 RepID=UPI000F8CA687|nr:D-glycerate dehydrogenase [Frigidibacter oleivorans]